MVPSDNESLGGSGTLEKAASDSSQSREENLRSLEDSDLEDYHDYLRTATSEIESIDSYHAHLKDIESPTAETRNHQKVQIPRSESNYDRTGSTPIRGHDRSSDEYHSYLKAVEIKDQPGSEETFDHKQDNHDSYLNTAKRPLQDKSITIHIGSSAPTLRDDQSLYLEIIGMVQKEKGVQEDTALDLLERWSRDYRAAHQLESTFADPVKNANALVPTQSCQAEEALRTNSEDMKSVEMDGIKPEGEVRSFRTMGSASDLTHNTLETLAGATLAQASEQGSSQGAFAIGAACVAAFAALSVAVTRLVLIELPLKDVESQKARDAGLEARTNVEKLKFEMQDVERKVRAAQKELDADRKALDNDRKQLKERTRLLEHRQKTFERDRPYWNSPPRRHLQEVSTTATNSQELSTTIATITMALNNLPAQLSEKAAVRSPDDHLTRSTGPRAKIWAEKIRQNVLEHRDDVGQQVVALCKELGEIFLEASVKWNHWVRYAEALKSRALSISSAG